MKTRDNGVLTDNTAAIIRDAVLRQKTISFIYNGKNKTVEAHAIGRSTKDGGLVLRGYQVAGRASRPLPIWALYRLDDIEGLSVDFTDSEAPREGYVLNDTQMQPVLFQIVP